MVVIAHAGHWVLYVIPVAIVAVAVAISAVRETLRSSSETEDPNRG